MDIPVMSQTSTNVANSNTVNTTSSSSILPAAPFPQPNPRSDSTSSINVSTYEHFSETAQKRIKTFTYLRHAHEGRMLWFNTIRLSLEDLTAMYETSRMKRRTGNFFILGTSLSSILEITNPHDYVRALTMMLQEFEDHTNEHSKQKMKMFFRKTKNTKDDDASFQESGEYTYLFVPNIPFDLDYFQTFYTLCDILVEVYNKLLADTKKLWTGQFNESVFKIDAKFKKIIALVTKEIDSLARDTIKDELQSIDPMMSSSVIGGISGGGYWGGSGGVGLAPGRLNLSSHSINSISTSSNGNSDSWDGA